MFDINKDDKSPEIPARCPQCRDLMARMGHDFAAPALNEIKSWQHLQNLYMVGITFHSCGCSGPGYIPRNKEQTINHFQEVLISYQKHLALCRQTNNDFNTNQEAMQYWIGKIKDVESKLASLS